MYIFNSNKKLEMTHFLKLKRNIYYQIYSSCTVIFLQTTFSCIFLYNNYIHIFYSDIDDISKNVYILPYTTNYL